MYYKKRCSSFITQDQWNENRRQKDHYTIEMGNKNTKIWKINAENECK